MAVPRIIDYNPDRLLYRHNDKAVAAGQGMANIYTNATKPTYFVVNPAKLGSYQKRPGTSKSFRSAGVYRLLDMSDTATVDWIRARAMPNELAALDIAFPRNLDGSYRRRSDGATKDQDDASMAAICRIIADEGIEAHGSHTNAQNSEEHGEFHEEVMLCPASFPHFRVDNSRVRLATAPNAGGKGKKPGGGGGGGVGGLSLNFNSMGGRRRTKKRNRSSYRRGGRRSRSGNAAN
jgi:hypothetical protein